MHKTQENSMLISGIVLMLLNKPRVGLLPVRLVKQAHFKVPRKSDICPRGGTKMIFNITS